MQTDTEPDRQQCCSHSMHPIPQQREPSIVTTDILKSFAQLSTSLANMQNILTEEREKYHNLLIENIKLKTKLIDEGASTGSHGKHKKLSSNNKENVIENSQDNAVNCNVVYEDIHSDLTSEIIAQRQQDNIKRKGKAKKNNSEIEDGERTKQESNSINKRNRIDRNGNGNTYQKKAYEAFPWKKNTVLILGDSMLSHINERTLSRRYTTKVRSFPGATADDLHHYIQPLLRKRPDKILLVIGTNDISYNSVEAVLAKIVSLTKIIHKNLPNCHIIISEIIERKNNPSLNAKISELNKSLKAMNVDPLQQQNIREQHLARDGLHLNFRGNRQLALNLIQKVRSFSF